VQIAHLRGDRRVTRALRQALRHDRLWVVSSLSHYEIYRAAHQRAMDALGHLFALCWTAPLTAAVAREAAEIYRELRQDGYTVDIPDQLIAATARIHGLAVTTLNAKHFAWVRRLRVPAPAEAGDDPGM
jgi:predicted nucleic acid-binding protein